jgi:site-specific recombinase XerD
MVLKPTCRNLETGKTPSGKRLNYTGYFLKWLDNEHLQANETRYNDLLNFIDYCKLEGKSKKHINRKLSSIRNYYDFLKKQNDPTLPILLLNLEFKRN